ncbi:hypothetical protein THMIRHAS_20640 [Thiosulfatimonas sediminis]|uniref:Cytochrome c domain-containing protein n=1 Tax=Thiosulfatimonas sediminis TaxID=2675054 RepID=A0A6F8PX39_9GAMM|nr:c-type cytochrome [Thiosulfatimonas sediminis]BBP46691.1 hypothetical protein THMIRHAS_20640 [Thiosulfatimonas sediminis]
MKVKIIMLTAALSSMAVAQQAMAQSGGLQPISKAELWATTCFQCHGAEGQYSGGAIPPLAGYPAEMMAQQLKAMKSGERATTIMQRHLLGYSDDDIDAIAAYLGSLKP